MKKLVKLLCMTLTLVILFACTTACSDKVEYTYWQTEAKQAGEARMIYSAELSLGSSNVDITEIWVNLDDMKCDNTTITIELLKTSTSTPTTLQCPVKAKDVKDSEDGWVQLYFDKSVSCKIVIIEIVDAMKVNEIYFVKKDGKGATPTFTKGGVRVNSSANLYDKTGLETLAESNLAYSENPAFNIIDEQDKFPVEKIQTQG